jgi:hypothetical protein
VINIFLLDFYARLRAWHELKESLQDADLQTRCIEVDKFWQQCPMMSHYLHPADIEDWPNPWDLLNDNNYCDYARALGMIYTLMLLGINDIDFVDALDDNANEVVLVLVDNAKYVMNWCPNSVVNTDLTQFKIVQHISTDSLTKKIGKP